MREVRGVPDQPGERSEAGRGAVSAEARARLAEVARWKAAERGELRSKDAQRRIDAVASERAYYRGQVARGREGSAQRGSPETGRPDVRDRPGPDRPGGRDHPGGHRDEAPDNMFSATDRNAPDTRPENAGRDQPAVKRPEWQGPLARGEVDRVGLGVVDDRSRPFTSAERRIADLLAAPGPAVVSLPEHYGARGRTPDAKVDSMPTEFKTLDPGASDRTVMAALNSAKGQARHAVIDTRDSGLSEDDANRGLRRFLGTPWAYRLDTARIVGDGFDLQWTRGD